MSTTNMTKEELAAQLTGREYRREITSRECHEAKKRSPTAAVLCSRWTNCSPDYNDRARDRRVWGAATDTADRVACGLLV